MVARLTAVQTSPTTNAKACAVEFDVNPNGHVNDKDFPPGWDSNEIPTILRNVQATILTRYPEAETAFGHITTEEGVALWFAFSKAELRGDH